jgi:ComF family protein
MDLARLLAVPGQLLWPARCAACDDYVPDAALFCPRCAPSVSPPAGACPGCALPLGDARSPGDGERCHVCRRTPFAFAGALAACEYGAALADAIVRMKHGGRRDLARRLARLLVDPLARAIDQSGFTGQDALVPVPLHPRKLRRRGFNQALELARVARALLVRRRGPPRSGRALPALERQLLRRVRDTRELGHMGRAARRDEVAGAFTVADPARVPGRRVLLVDDVFTTGATLNECARVLRAAGARQVRVVTLARVV